MIFRASKGNRIFSGPVAMPTPRIECTSDCIASTIKPLLYFHASSISTHFNLFGGFAKKKKQKQTCKTNEEATESYN